MGRLPGADPDRGSPSDFRCWPGVWRDLVPTADKLEWKTHQLQEAAGGGSNAGRELVEERTSPTRER